MRTWRERESSYDQVTFQKDGNSENFGENGLKNFGGKEMLPVYRGSGISGAGISGPDCI